jgi:hypothetical protein
MSFGSILKAVGKDLGHVGSWIEDGIKIAAPILGAVDPPLGALMGSIGTAIDSVLKSIPASTAMSAAQLQQIITSIATLEMLKTPAATPTS